MLAPQDWDNVFSILVCCKRSGNIDGGRKEQTHTHTKHLPVMTEKQDSRNQIKTIKTSWFTQHEPLAIQWLLEKDTVSS